MEALEFLLRKRRLLPGARAPSRPIGLAGLSGQTVFLMPSGKMMSGTDAVTPGWARDLQKSPVKRLTGLRRAIGSEPAKAAEMLRKRRKVGAGGSLYPEAYTDSCGNIPLVQVDLEAGLKSADFDLLEKEVFSKRTLATRRSHLRIIVNILKKEFGITFAKSDEEVLRECYNSAGLKVAAAELMRRKIKTGANYLSSWKSLVCRMKMIDTTTAQLAKDYAKAFGKMPTRTKIGQAPELSVAKIFEKRDREGAIVSGGPRWPFLSTLVMIFFMLRGLAWRSLQMEQMMVPAEKGNVVLTILTRKSNQEGTPKEVPLPCICRSGNICPSCVTREYVQRRRRRGGKFLFVNEVGTSVSARGVRKHFEALGQMQGLARFARAHSARVSGARWWLRTGASTESISEIGDWSDVRTLKHYLGSLVMIQRLQKELNGSDTSQSWRTAWLIQRTVEATLDTMRPLRADSGVQTSVKTAVGNDEKGELAIVSRRGKVRSMHSIGCRVGPLETWKTRCGEWFNFETMTLQNVSEIANGAPCGRCHRG